MNHNSFLYLSTRCAIILALTFLTFYFSASVQANSIWSSPVLISETATGNASPSITTSDTGHVFAAWIFNSPEELETVGSIYLARGQEGEWSSPVDVLAPYHNRGLSNLKVVASSEGQLYLMWQEQSVKISSAPIADALNPRQWSPPVEVIAPLRRNLGIADLAIDNEGTLHVSYPDEQSVNYVQSKDGGLTWSAPVVAGQIPEADQVIHGSRLTVASNGHIYIVWNALQLPDGWPPQGVYVATSYDAGVSFEQRQLEGLNHNYINVIAAEDNTIHAVWNTAVGLGGRYHSTSEDGGVSWTEPNRFTELSGSTQLFVMLMFDPWNNLHLGTIADGTINNVRHDQSIFYMTWNENWSPPELVASLPQGDAHRIAMTVSEGNKIHILWQQGGGSIWYATKTTSMPHIPIGSLDTTITTNSDRISVTEVPSMSDNDSDNLNQVSPQIVPDTTPPPSGSRTQPLLLGVLSALIVIGVGIGISISRK
jgi:hypothetical protein